MTFSRRTLLALGSSCAVTTLVGCNGPATSPPMPTPSAPPPTVGPSPAGSSPAASPSPSATPAVDPQFFLQQGSLARALADIRHHMPGGSAYALVLTPGALTVEFDGAKVTWTGPAGEFRKETFTPPDDALPIDLETLPLVDLPEVLRRAERASQNPGPPNPLPSLHVQNRASLGLPVATIEPSIKHEVIHFDEALLPRRRLDLTTSAGVATAYAELLYKTGLTRTTQVALEPLKKLELHAPNDERVTGVEKADSMTISRAPQAVYSGAVGIGQKTPQGLAMDARDVRTERVFEALQTLQAEGTVDEWWAQILPDNQGRPTYALTTRGAANTQRSIHVDAAGKRLR